LEEQKKSEGVGQLVQAKEIDQNDGSQADVSAGSDAENGAENCLKITKILNTMKGSRGLFFRQEDSQPRDSVFESLTTEETTYM
jgi:hypothetical protein